MTANPTLWPDAALAAEALQIQRRAGARIEAFCARERIPEGVRKQLGEVYLPLATLIARERTRRAPASLVAGIAGAQGTGKSTVSALLAGVLDAGFDLRAARVSLDDLYLTRAARAELAARVHPLLVTRGVPGTHDVALGLHTIDALRSARGGEAVACPHFDKARDDRAPESAWPRWHGPADVVLFEGWCVGATPELDGALQTPINALERDADPDARWRRFVNVQLAGPYRALFAQVQLQVFLAAPDMACVLAWRTQQEHELAARAPDAPGLMSDAQLARFVQHYERLTRHMLATTPARADVTLQLAPDHRVASVVLQRR
jgi:D-glycerate 3-kinase